MKKTYGLVGYPLGHSFSQSYFSAKFEREGIKDTLYHNYAIEQLEQLGELLEGEPQLMGFNVTIPYKEQIIPQLDSLSSEAAAIGAVNCVKRDGERLVGYNTDAYGFEVSLLQTIEGRVPKRALILGSGGAARAVAYVLQKLGIEYSVVSRKATILGEDEKGDTKGAKNWYTNRVSYDQLSDKEVTESHLIINTTPLGMYPEISSLPQLNYSLLTPHHTLYDLVYNPELTAFMAEGRRRGAKVKNGYQMLVEQAERSWQIWNFSKSIENP